MATAPVTNITSSSATAGGNVQDSGATQVTERGVVYATNPNPTVSDTKVQSGSGVGSFTANLTGLTSLTTYYVRAYAVNSWGVSYGQQVNFYVDSASCGAVVEGFAQPDAPC